jgi:hypothetical protein
MVLSASDEYLSKADREFLAVVEELNSPYMAERLQATERSDFSGETTARVVAPIVYDHGSVLKAVAASFSTQVRGTLAKGSTRYLQLQGGGLLQSGMSFPAKLPELKNKSFIVTLSDVDGRGYTLQLDEAELFVPFDQAYMQSPGAIKFTGE